MCTPETGGTKGAQCASPTRARAYYILPCNRLRGRANRLVRNSEFASVKTDFARRKSESAKVEKQDCLQEIHYRAISRKNAR